MKLRKKKHVTRQQRKAWANRATALRMDPTRTATLRKRMCVDFGKRLAKVRLSVADLIVRQQVFRFQWGTLPTADKVSAFNNWLQQTLKEQLFGLNEWTTKYLVAAYLRGATRSYDEVKKRKPTDQTAHLGGKQEFIRHLIRKQVQARPVVNSEPNCGTGAGGFKPGNTCARKYATLSDFAKHPLPGSSKEMFSTLLEGLEASKAAHEVTERLDVLTKDFLRRAMDNPELEDLHDRIHTIAVRVNYWVLPQSQTAVEWRRRMENPVPGFSDTYPGQNQDLASIHHKHTERAHRQVIAELSDLNQYLKSRNLRDLIKRHKEAAALHNDAGELLRLETTPFTANIASRMQDVEGRFMSTRLHTLSQRLLGELQGITAAVAQRIARELLEGLEAGETAEQISKRITTVVDTIGRVRALALANTELVRAHAEGQLDALEDLGEEEVTAAVEWSTAGDNKVCSRCKPLDGVILHIEEARGLIPRHVNCRCAWSPAGTEEQQEGRVLKDSLKDVTTALKRSIVAGPAEDTWFEGKAVRRKRPEVVRNAFDPNQPRDRATGRWMEVGGYRQFRSFEGPLTSRGVHLPEPLEASQGAVRVSRNLMDKLRDWMANGDAQQLAIEGSMNRYELNQRVKLETQELDEVERLRDQESVADAHSWVAYGHEQLGNHLLSRYPTSEQARSLAGEFLLAAHMHTDAEESLLGHPVRGQLGRDERIKARGRKQANNRWEPI